jgi:hypothetical protein
MKSSSFININGDLKQNKIKLLIYLFFNFIQNIYYSLFKNEFKFLIFSIKNKKYKLSNKHSISRKFCTVFWNNVNWSSVTKAIGKLNILELGPGDGNYFKKNISIKKHYISEYNGFDVNFHNRWDVRKNKKFKFHKFNGNNFGKIIDKKNNLFNSQSCLEHVKYDLKFFNDIKILSKKTNKKIVLIHCLPNSFCLFTYLAHGYRQYNSQNINKISKILGKENTQVIKLGNLKFNLEHLTKTTLPLIFKKKNLMAIQNQKYHNRINKEIMNYKESSLFLSSFIVLIGTINFNKTEKNKFFNSLFYSD